MARAYSQDLRDRVIDAVVDEGMARRDAADRFGVSVSSATLWVRIFRKDGRRSPLGTRGHRRSKVKPEGDWLLSLIASEPDLTLWELSARLLAERGVKVDAGMLSRFFKCEGISYKKKYFARGAGSS